jgi:hypothetical protein
MKKNKQNIDKTILTIVLGFLVLNLISKTNWTIYTSLIIGILGLSSEYIAKKITFFWFKIAEILGYIVPNIILSIIFFFFLFPLSVLSKIFSSNNGIRLKNNNASNYVSLNKDFDTESFKNPW